MVNILVVELDRGDESDWKEILAFLKGKMHCQVSVPHTPYPELYRKCKRKGQLWLSKTVLIRLKNMEKDITLERFFYLPSR